MLKVNDLIGLRCSLLFRNFVVNGKCGNTKMA